MNKKTKEYNNKVDKGLSEISQNPVPKIKELIAEQEKIAEKLKEVKRKWRE